MIRVKTLIDAELKIELSKDANALKASPENYRDIPRFSENSQNLLRLLGTQWESVLCSSRNKCFRKLRRLLVIYNPVKTGKLRSVVCIWYLSCCKPYKNKGVEYRQQRMIGWKNIEPLIIQNYFFNTRSSLQQSISLSCSFISSPESLLLT